MNTTLASTVKKEKGRIVNTGMGGFLCPPTHPEHSLHVQIDLRRREENRGGMSLSAAVDADWLDAGTRAAAKRFLSLWQAPPVDSPEIVKWIRSVLGYFAGCYSGQDKDGNTSWNVSDLRITKEADPYLSQDHHAGVHLIRKYYPEFIATREDFANAKWGN